MKGCHLRAGSGQQLPYPKEVDEEILEWVLVRRDAHLPVSRTLIKVKARHLVRPHNSDFVASSGWLEKFMIRHGLSLRCKTSISQKLPAQLERKLECFLNEVNIMREKHKYPDHLIINMDETPMYFDMLPQYTILKKGTKEVRIRSSGAEKRNLTVALCCTGSGEMLPSLAIFKGKRKLKFKSPKDVNVAVQVKGWMDGDLMLWWFQGTIVPYTRGERALLLIDSFSVHETDEFMEMAKDTVV